MGQILYVEDDPVLGKGVKLNLELEGYNVTWVQNLASAFRENENQNFNLVVLDLGLPDGNGLTFCQRLRDDGSRIPIIILTAQTDESSVVAGLSSGANDYVRKPFGNRERLMRHLDRSGEIFYRTLDSHVSHIRAKLRKAGVSSVQINSVYGVGYRLEKTA